MLLGKGFAVAADAAPDVVVVIVVVVVFVVDRSPRIFIRNHFQMMHLAW
jgi:hypothetical protein